MPSHITLPPNRQASLWINHALSSPRRLHKLRILLLQNRIILLRFPVPDAVACKDQVHLLERALVGFRVEGPDYDYADYVYGAKDVEGFFVEAVEYCGE
jgi:hypothetical protein